MNWRRIWNNTKATIAIVIVLVVYGLIIAGGMCLTHLGTKTGSPDTVLVVGALSLILSFLGVMTKPQEFLLINFHQSKVNILAVISLATAIVAALSGYFSNEEQSVMRNVTYWLLVVIFFGVILKEALCNKNAGI